MLVLATVSDWNEQLVCGCVLLLEMNKVLGIDYGRKKIGLAIGDPENRLAEPFRILRYEDIKIMVEGIKKIISENKIDIIVIGLSEGKMAEETREFGKKLQKEFIIPVEYQDETLTSHDAQLLSIEAGIRRKKRKNMEDAYAAALILQSWFDTKS